ncbi:MAG: Ig-like domain repeat protein, partial [Actinobacteria bacterium]
YQGDTNFASSSTTNPLVQTVDKAATTTIVSSSLNPSGPGDAVTFTASVGVISPGAGAPSGNVTFLDGATTLGTGPLGVGGQATFSSSSLSPGPHSIRASYPGDPNFATSSSTAVVQTVKSPTAKASASGPALLRPPPEAPSSSPLTPRRDSRWPSTTARRPRRWSPTWPSALTRSRPHTRATPTSPSPPPRSRLARP